jgi:hypothetical protein
MRTVDLTLDEWRSLGSLPLDLDNLRIPVDHQKKLIRLGVAAEKSGRLTATFEGRLMLREHGLKKR